MGKITYAATGVNIDNADSTKKAMAGSLETNDARVLNKIGAFATLFDGKFPDYEHPVLVLKSEEPGSKQKLAFAHGHYESVCYDLVNHLINDIIVMGARPLSVQDVIVCGKIEKNVVTKIVDGMASACREQNCTLTGGETSEQPGVVASGTYILTASIVGVVEKESIIDGQLIAAGDQVIAIESNGLHTNGYTLVRALLDAQPDLAEVIVDGESFIEAILKPHQCYYKGLSELYNSHGINGMAHITGGGIRDNIERVLPDSLNAKIDLSKIEIPSVFKILHQRGQLDTTDMIRTFNMGVGLALIVAKENVEPVKNHLASRGYHSYMIGEIGEGSKQVQFTNELQII
ncbi:MAG: phosphoribosylformylglycinamidine cyclo-ligase [Candidatus Latescibacterota bacterium]|nr:phosphoribosylformylglycinamidine cyclo-ligase [Candidatus Latescibacterota bacterium]